jgi:hypothetical protein
MNDHQNTWRASHFFTGASLAQTCAKSLKSFAPVTKSCGALGVIYPANWHKKTPKP